MSIPHTLHQIWYQGGDKLPLKYRRYRTTWQQHHPDWTCRLWDAESLRAHIAQHQAWLLPIYDAFPHDIQRIDCARYCVLATLGGVYVDVDIECLRPIDELLAGRELLLSDTQGYNNALIGSAPHHPLWETVFRYLEDEVRASAEDVPPWLRESVAMEIAVTVGPRFFTLCVERSGVVERADTLCCPGYYFEGAQAGGYTDQSPPPYGRHDMDLNWMSRRARWLSKVTRVVPTLIDAVRRRLTRDH